MKPQHFQWKFYTLISSVVVIVICGIDRVGHAQSATEKIAVYVQAGDSAGGFTDPSKERNEAAEDIRKKIGQSKVLRLETADKASIVVQVLNREIVSRPSSTNPRNMLRVSTITARLKVGDYTFVLTGDASHNDGYAGTTRAANSIVAQVEKWAIANRDKLHAAPR